jgi:SAM-dependent methyltransferase
MSSSLDGVPPFELFGGVADEVWRWLCLDGREQCPFLERYLPGLTGDPEWEKRIVGSSGKEALSEGFEIYRLFKTLSERYGNPLSASTRVLDFGCGWGRVICFFLKDVAPENLIGIDVDKRAVNACRGTNHWCWFEACDWFPPSGWMEGSFDLIYAFSVFSHLSEEAHQRWLEEFERLLKPSGVLIVTTFPRKLLAAAAQWPEVAERFSPVEPWLDAYDRGEYCYAAQSEENPHLGHAFIPERYVRRNWAGDFRIHEYLRRSVVFQDVIVCGKPQ